MNIDFGTKYWDRELKYLDNLVNSWAESVNKYSFKMPGDAGYWYNERANISLLSAGAWNAGYVALEEYSHMRKNPDNDISGRADLFISMGKRDISIEAKKISINPYANEDKIKGRILNAFQRAINDVRTVTEDSDKYGVVFFVPWFMRSKITRLISEKGENAEAVVSREIKKFIQRIVSNREIQLWAWCFPPASRLLQNEDEREYWPGLLIGFKKYRFQR